MTSVANQMAETLCNMQGMKLAEMLERIRSEFPSASREDIDTAFGLAKDEMLKRAKHYNDEADALRDLAHARASKAIG